MYLIADIETVLDPDFPAPAEGKFPSAGQNQIVCIGLCLMTQDGQAQRLNCVQGDTEEDILRGFIRIVEKTEATIVSFNGRKFDLPVIAHRCFRHGIPFPEYYQERDMRYRYSTAKHFDIMDYMSDYGASQFSKLDMLAQLCGLPGKLGVDGSQVQGMYEQGRIQEIRDYCLCDVVQTAGVFLRVQLLRGVLSLDEYRERAQSLLAHSDPIREKTNLDRFYVRS